MVVRRPPLEVMQTMTCSLQRSSGRSDDNVRVYSAASEWFFLFESTYGSQLKDCSFKGVTFCS